MSCGGAGFPRISGRRSSSPHPLSPNGVVPVLKKTNKSQERGKTRRNIEVVSFQVSPGNKENEQRPQTAPQSVYRWVVWYGVVCGVVWSMVCGLMI